MLNWMWRGHVPNLTNIPGSRVALVDQAGFITREWYRWFYNTFVLLGTGSNATSLEDVQLGPVNQSVIETEAFQNIAPLSVINYTTSEVVIPTPIYNLPTQSTLSDLAPVYQLGTASSINYLSGNWTPDITASTNNPTFTYVTQRGEYIRMGNLVKCEGYIEWSNISGGNGDIQISVPFNFKTDDASGCISKLNGITFPTTRVFGGLKGVINQSYMNITGLATASSTVTVAVADLAANGYLTFSIDYIAL